MVQETSSHSSLAPREPSVLWITRNSHLAGEVDKLLALHGVCAVSLQEPQLAMDKASRDGVSLFVLDLESDGFDAAGFCRSVKKEDSFKETPILVLARREKTEEKLAALQAGAEDYVNLPADSSELSERILSLLNRPEFSPALSSAKDPYQDLSRDQLIRISKAVDSSSDAICILDAEGAAYYINQSFRRLFQLDLQAIGEDGVFQNSFRKPEIWDELLEKCRKGQSWRGEVELETHEGRVIPTFCRADTIFESNQRLQGFVVLFTDISQRKRLEKDLRYLANHDPLTGLYNRRHFNDILQDAIEEAKQGKTSYLLYIDLDNFKIVNDSVGHAVGDQMLMNITQLLQANTRKQDPIGRFGGDEFTILLKDVGYPKAIAMIRKLVKLLDDHRVSVQGANFATSASIGVASVDGTATSEDVLAQADSACFLVKTKGRNGYSIYKPNNAEISQLNREANWSMAIKDALREDRFELWLQPIRYLKNRVNAYYEVLIRMRDRKGNLILPGAFMPAAERFGNMHQLDLYVVQGSIDMLKRYPQLRLSINLSAKTMNDPNLPGFIERLFREAGVEPSRAVFEITETDMIQNMGHAKDLISRIKRLGCFFALDDFGAGASSLSYLRELPVDILKIDGSFIKALDKDNINRSLVKAINEVAHILGKQTVAEFVINASVLNVVQELGIDYAQGFHICVPAPPSAFFSLQRGVHDPE